MSKCAVTSTDILDALRLSEEAVRSHVFLPDHVANASTRIELHDAAEGDADPIDPPPSGLFYRLNVEKLGRDLHLLLSNCLDGYSLQLRRYGRPLLDEQWRWARRPMEGAIHWAPSVKMHVASVSKLITAMALTKLLESRGISPDAPIAPWLPGYWQRGPGVNQITFRKLLTHTSGLVNISPSMPGPSDFQFMKDQVAIGATSPPVYRNVNYGLCRILIATIEGTIPFKLFGSGLSDAFWDVTTIRAYARYVQEHIFDPVGVASAFTHGSDDALGYPFPAVEPGWDSGDLSTMSGCAAWHLSVDDLLIIMASFRRLGLAVSPYSAGRMLDRQFGIDVKRDTALGRIYAKGGYWSNNGIFVEQCNVFFLPKGMELAILGNSPFCTPNGAFMGKVLNAIEDNIESLALQTIFASAAVLGIVSLLRVTTGSTRRH